jgi:hypothetical protein
VRSDEAEAGGEGADVSTGEGAEVGGVNIIDDGDGIIVAGDVVARDAQGPDVFAKLKLIFDAEI